LDYAFDATVALGGNLKFSLKQLLTAILIGSIVIIILQRPIRLLLAFEWVSDFGHGFVLSFWPVFWLCYNEDWIDTSTRPGFADCCGMLIGLILQTALIIVLIDRIMFLWKRLHTGETSDLST
jgi:hypothetical protein